MKIRLWHILVFVLALIVFAATLAPAAFFAPRRSETFAYERAAGSIWHARLEAVRIGPFAARAITWRLFPLDLIQGKARLPLTFEGEGMDGHGMVLANMHGDRRLHIPVLTLDGSPALPGTTRISDLDIFFDDGRCAFASGRIESDVLARMGAAIGWEGPPLSGEAACDGEAARVALEGANSAGDRVRALLSLDGGGRAHWLVSVNSAAPEAAALAGLGFQPAGEGMEYSGVGRWLPF